MEDKPTHASITALLCTCGYLQNAADDPTNPIVFDNRTNEFQFKFNDCQGNCSGMLIIYHCPFCGGAAPKSKRDLLFAVIPPDEEARLVQILKPIETISEAASTLGVPDFDDYSVCHYPEQEGTPPSRVYHREIRYYGLSNVAEVCFTERQDGKVYWQLQGKRVDKGHAGN